MSPRSRLTVLLLAIAWAHSAGAAQLSWYGDGAHLGGNGTWDTTSATWSANGTTFKAWNNSNVDGATFDYDSMGPGFVYLGTPVTANNLTFNDTGFELYGDGTSALTLAGSAAIRIVPGAQALFSGVPLAGTAGMNLSGGGELVLTSSNAYSGTTTVSAAYLQLAASNALPGGNLAIDGGVVELAAGSFTLASGTAGGQVRFTANGGGFAAADGNYAVNLGGLSAPMTWGSANFLPGSGTSSATLVLGSPWAGGTVDFQNPIDLGGADRTVYVNAGSGTAAIDARLSGAVSGSNGLNVTGDGSLALAASNSYSGGTAVDGVMLSVQNRWALGGGSVTLSGGTLQLATSLSGTPAIALVDASTIDISGTSSVTLGGIDLGSNALTVSGSQSAAFAGAISGTGGSLVKQGSGKLVLSGANTYSGGTTVVAGTLDLAAAAALPGGTALRVFAGGKVIFDPTATAAPAVPGPADSGTVAVPEPGTLALLLAAAILLTTHVSCRRSAKQHLFRG